MKIGIAFDCDLIVQHKDILFHHFGKGEGGWGVMYSKKETTLWVAVPPR
jgi:hypothetical protein